MIGRWERLEPFAQMYAEMEQAIEHHVATLNARELRSLEALTNKPTQTNCWWSVYHVAPLVRDAIKAERYRRKHAKRSAKPDTEGEDK